MAVCIKLAHYISYADTTARSQVSEQLHLLPQNLVINGSCIKLLKSIGEGM